MRSGMQAVCHSTNRVAVAAAAGMLRAMNTLNTSAHERDFQRIAVAIGFMADHVRRQPSLEEVAAAADLSPYHFARLFRRWAGISPKQYLQRLSLDTAKRSLAERASVLEAALDAGLSGPGRLHDLFVVIEAVTPGDFKSGGRGVLFRHGLAGTPFGVARVVTTARGIAFLGFTAERGAVPGWSEFRQVWHAARWVEDPRAAQDVADAIWGVAPRLGREIRLWVHGSNFQVQVWQALVRHAGEGAVSYADIARAIGQPSAARAVGSAVGANPVAWLIPCHHVLRADGGLGGYRWGVERKRAMLAWERSRAAANPG
jgi:AraC family transcriptional regulator of adaptative response/methylated-DNA-[protein]-cysteine methyltransferase